MQVKIDFSRFTDIDVSPMKVVGTGDDRYDYTDLDAEPDYYGVFGILPNGDAERIREFDFEDQAYAWVQEEMGASN